MTSMKVKDVAKRVIEAKENGQESVQKEIDLFVDALFAETKAKIKPGSKKEVCFAALRDADTRFKALAGRVENHGIKLNRDAIRLAVRDSDPSMAHMMGWI